MKHIRLSYMESSFSFWHVFSFSLPQINEREMVMEKKKVSLIFLGITFLHMELHSTIIWSYVFCYESRQKIFLITNQLHVDLHIHILITYTYQIYVKLVIRIFVINFMCIFGLIFLFHKVCWEKLKVGRALIFLLERSNPC